MTTYTSRLKLTLPGDGEFDGTWGTVVNDQITSLIDDAVAGYTQVTVSDVADTTLTVADGLPSQSRNMIISLQGTLTATRSVICPATSKIYVVRNATVSLSPIIFKTASGSGVSVPNGTSMLLMCDGTNVVNAVTPASSSGTAGVFADLSYSGNFTGAAGPSVINIGGGEFYKSATSLIGIGTAAPASKLHVNDAGDNKMATVIIDNQTQGAGAGARYQVSAYASTWYLNTYAQQNTTQGGKFTISAASSGKTLLSLDPSGVVTLPTGGLQVIGFAATVPATVLFSATSMVINCAESNVFNIVMTANVTTAPVFLSPQDGQTANIFFTQDSTGSRTMTWGPSIKWPGGIPGVLSTVGNSVDLVVMTYRAFAGSWYATISKGFVCPSPLGCFLEWRLLPLPHLRGHLRPYPLPLPHLRGHHRHHQRAIPL